MTPPLPYIAAGLIALIGWPVAPALACEASWYIRNLIAHRSGYCFASPLGQALFDNSACVPGPLTLSPEDAARVRVIRDNEIAEGCAVDTTATALPYGMTDWAWDLIETLPIPTPYESGCIGYRLAILNLRAAPRADAAVIGQVHKGVSIGFSFENEGEWVFVSTDTGQIGWLIMTEDLLGESACEMWAG